MGHTSELTDDNANQVNVYAYDPFGISAGKADTPAMTVARSTDDWVEAMEAAGVPCGPINTLDKVFAHPQVRARGMRVAMQHELNASVPLTANPIRLSESPVAYRHAPPTLGQHTDEVLMGWLGLGAQDVAGLRERRIV